LHTDTDQREDEHGRVDETSQYEEEEGEVEFIDHEVVDTIVVPARKVDDEKVSVPGGTKEVEEEFGEPGSLKDREEQFDLYANPQPGKIF
jgi:hypothetical protein